MASEKAIQDALTAFYGHPWQASFDPSDEVLAGKVEDMRAALDAAAAVDGDAQWNAAIEAAESIAENFGPRRPLAEKKPNERIYGRWEGEQAASAGIAAAIRSLKRG